MIKSIRNTNERPAPSILYSISKLFRTGDFIRLRHYNYVLMTEGILHYIDFETVVIRRADGTFIGVRGSDINSFESFDTTCFSQLKNFSKKTQEYISERQSTAPASTQEHNVEDPDYSYNHRQEESPYEPAEAELNAGFDLKLKQKIDLDELARIDPKFDKRQRFFHSATGDNDSDIPYSISSDNTSDNDNEDTSNTNISDKDYIQPNGIVENIGPVFGFIRTEDNPINAHFYRSNIIDSALYNNIRAGMPVVCTYYKSERGRNAFAVHRPGTVEDLLNLAHDHINRHRYTEAAAVAQHILNVFPDNEEAQSIVECYAHTGDRTQGPIKGDFEKQSI